MYFPQFLRRRFRHTLREPRLNFVYRTAGFSLFLAFGAGTLMATYYPAAVHVSATWMALGTVSGAVLLFAGLASSEAWESAMSRVNFSAYATPYGRKRLAVFTGVLSFAIAAVVLLLLL